MGYDSVTMFYIVLIVLCGCAVATCVAGHPSVLGVCGFVCVCVRACNTHSTCC